MKKETLIMFLQERMVLIAARQSHVQFLLDQYLPAHHIRLNHGYNTEQHLE